MTAKEPEVTHELAERVLAQCVGTAAIGELLAEISGRRISAQAINNRTKRDGFPTPVLDDGSSRGRLWLRSEVEEHLRAAQGGGEER